GIRVAPLAVSMALATGGTSSNTTTPTIVGYSEQTAFGNTVHVKLYDITDPSNRILLGEADTDGTGKFSIPVNNPLTAGVHALAAVVTDDTGAIGPDGKLTITV